MIHDLLNMSLGSAVVLVATEFLAYCLLASR
jgi:hypothetical protein